MNLEYLRHFLVVADCLNFTAAAERLYLSQSTISRQIASLEQDLGVPLLIRATRSAELTQAGRLLQQEGKKLLDLSEEITQKVIETGLGTSGEIRISMVPASFSCITEIYLKLHERYPDICLKLNFSKYINILQDLDQGTSDLAVTYSFLDPHDAAYEIIPLQASRFHVFCSPDNPIAQHPEGIFRDALREEDILFGQSGLILSEQPQTYHGEPSPAESRSTKSMENDMFSIQTSDQVMILPEFSVTNGKYNVARVPLLDEDLVHQIILCYRKNAVTSVMERFLEAVNLYLKEREMISPAAAG